MATRTASSDPYNPVDAIFAAARYLKAAGYEHDARQAMFAYNHAGWYVDSVMLRARLIAGVPADLIGSLTGLTEGRFPVAARARYADDLQEAEAHQAHQAAATTPPTWWSTDDNRHDIDIFAKQRLPRGVLQRRRDQEDRPVRQARPLRGPPGRVRQPLHLRQPGLDGEVLPRAQGRTPPTRRTPRAP